jgi:hypothetical protein
MASRGGRAFDFTNPLYSFNSSTKSLSLSKFDWALYRITKGGVKINTLLDNDTRLPVFVSIAMAKAHDIIAARSLSMPKGSIVAMDRGMMSYVVKDLEILASAVKPSDDESKEADGK